MLATRGVVMVNNPSHQTPSRPDPRDIYTPDMVRRLLDLYPYLLDHLGQHDDPSRGRRGRRVSFVDPVIGRAHRKADIDRALIRLFDLGQDPVAAHAICAYYGVNPFRGEPVPRVPIDVIAEAFGRSERTAYRVIERGIRRMAQLLGWRPRANADNDDDDRGSCDA